MIVSVALKDQYDNKRTIELALTAPLTGSQAAKEAENIANRNNPPAGWPYGVPCGPWEFAGSFKRVPA